MGKKFDQRSPFKYPLTITWDITSVCNANCIMCYSSSSSEKAIGNELNTDEALRLVDEIADMNVFSLSLSGGEPTLRRDLEIIIKRATDLGIGVSTGSNGISVDRERLLKLKDNGLKIFVVSIHGVNAKTHDFIRGIQGSFEKAINTIKIANEIGLSTGISTTLMKYNYKELPAILELALELKVSFHSTSLFVATGRGNLQQDLSPKEYQDFFKFWKLKRDELYGRITLETHHETLYFLLDPSFLKDNIGHMGCLAGYSIMRITPDGYVTPCNLLPIVAGNVRKQKLKDIWKNAKIFQDLRNRKLLKGKCGLCEYKYICGGCRSTAYAYYKDILAEDPRCWYKPKQEESKNG
ncbi:hypothetical protein CVT91_12080 [Candidatus Atribacteria bacterium HGW-Atribacteria-1]|nr:MAG: hypothetical protein CVT91_12080 [Candidatus Atribacteria bacterium HGW-Atribacteria-1]